MGVGGGGGRLLETRKANPKTRASKAVSWIRNNTEHIPSCTSDVQNSKAKKAALPIFKPWINHEAMQSQSRDETSKNQTSWFLCLTKLGGIRLRGMRWSLATSWNGMNSSMSWHLSLPASLSQVQHVLGEFCACQWAGRWFLAFYTELLTFYTGSKVRSSALTGQTWTNLPRLSAPPKMESEKTWKGRFHHLCCVGGK